jgi:hypothetical protein
MMRRSTAALYCDMPVAEFERGVALGTLPPAFQCVDQPRWSRALLDEYLERLTGEATPDFRSKSNLYAA